MTGNNIGIKSDLIEEWIETDLASNIVLYCEKKITEIKNKSNKTDSDNINNYNPSNYPLVFVDLDKELFFKKYLKNFDCIDNNGKPIKGNFQPYCDAFYKAVQDLEDDNYITTPKIIQRGRNKNKFIDMVNTEYNQTILKLSNGNKHRDIAIDFIIKSFGN
jgi:hypothetical protein